RHAASAAASFEQRRGTIREEALNEFPLRRPEPELMRGTRVVQHRGEVVEVGADGSGGNFFQGRSLMKLSFLPDCVFSSRQPPFVILSAAKNPRERPRHSDRGSGSFAVLRMTNQGGRGVALIAYVP